MNVSIKVGLSIVATCLALGGCADFADPTIGKGPVKLSDGATKAFTDYQARQVPRFFAVSTDGKAFFYSFCDAGRCIRQAKTQVIDKCETFSNGVPCKIYASRGKVVWAEGGS